MSEVTQSVAPIGRRMLDVSGLPRVVFGHRHPLWWGVWLLIAIEGTMFALLASSYFYLRGNESTWPPTGAANPPLLLTGTTVALLLASCVPAYIAFAAALHSRLRTVRLGMLALTIVSFIAAVTRAMELAAFGYRWNSHAYGSIVWAIYFMHTLHLVTGVIENAVLTTLLFAGSVEKKHMVDIRLSVIYWWFVAVVWVLLWAMVMFDDVLFRNSIVS